MTTEEDEFKQRFAAVLHDLQTNGKDDPEAVWVLGSIAGRIVDDATIKLWGEFKRTLSRNAYDTMLMTFQKQGNELVAAGKTRAAYAVQVLAVSVIAWTQTDPEVRAGDALLDSIIDHTIAVYRRNKTPEPVLH